MFTALLFDQTSGANASLDTGPLDPGSFDALLIEEIPSGSASAGTLQLLDPDSGAVLASFATAASANPGSAGWGFGVSGPTSGTYLGGLPAPLPPKVRVVLSALGIGITGRLRILGARIGR